MRAVLTLLIAGFQPCLVDRAQSIHVSMAEYASRTVARTPVPARQIPLAETVRVSNYFHIFNCCTADTLGAHTFNLCRINNKHQL